MDLQLLHGLRDLGINESFPDPVSSILFIGVDDVLFNVERIFVGEVITLLQVWERCVLLFC